MIKELVREEKSSLASDLLSLQQEIEEKERSLFDQQQHLETLAAQLSNILRGKSNNGEVEMLPEQIFLWRRQAFALNRSAKHLEKIDRFVDLAKDILGERVSIPLRDCGAMLIDQREFIDLAFELIQNEAVKKLQ